MMMPLRRVHRVASGHVNEVWVDFREVDEGDEVVGQLFA